MNLSNFKKFAGPVITRRAQAYYDEGRVLLLEESEGEYEYIVSGTKNYSVSIELDSDDIIRTSCDCPYSGMCKHVTAALIDISNRREAEKAPKPGPAQPESVASKNDNATQKNGLGLTEDETFILCYLAFSGSSVYDRSLLSYLQRIAPSPSYSQTSFERIKKSLRAGNWMSRNDGIGAVNPAKVLLALIVLVRNHKPWLDYFEANLHQPYYLQYLTDVAKVMSGWDVPAVRYFHSGYRYYLDPGEYVREALLQILDVATSEQIGRIMDDVIICDIVSILLRRFFAFDKTDDLDKVAALLPLLGHASSTSASLYSRYRLAVFYARAEELPVRASSGNYHETYYLEAAKSLMKGNTDSAISHYQAGLKIQKKNSAAKNIPDDCITFFLYVVALSTRRNEKDIAALSAILKKRYDILFADKSFVFPLVAFSVSSDQTREDSFIKDAAFRYDSGQGYAQNCVAALLACFLGFRDEWKQPFPKPKTGILRNECEAYFGDSLPSSEVRWPYEPVLPKIPVRAVWELQVEELISMVGPPAKSTAASVEKRDENRLYYVYSPYSKCVEVREQSRLGSGGWSKGKKVSMIRYKTGDCPMDSIDGGIYSDWLKGDPAFDRHYAQSEMPSLELVLPFLVGTDKLAVNSGGTLRNATVREEKPFLWTEKREDGIWFGTNVPAEARQYNSMFVEKPSDRELVIYRISAELIPAFVRILRIRHLPIESEPLLEKLFEALQGRLEIHSDISGGISLEKVDGSAVVTVRIAPESDAFVLRALVRPLEGGNCEFFPGEGDAVIYDSRAGERLEVSRNLRREASNLRKVSALLPEGCAFSSGASDCVLDAPVLLDFMESAEKIPNVVELEWPEGEAFRIHKPDVSKWEINAVGKGGWYELEGDLSVSEDKLLSVADLLFLLRQTKGGRYIKIGEKEFMLLSDSLRRQLERLSFAAQENRGRLRIPELAMAVAGDNLSGELLIDEPDALLELRERIRRSRDVNYRVPAELNADLRDYQVDGFRWMMRLASWGAGACLADDMGLGKTVQAIAFMLARSSEGPSMVVAPASVVSNWQREMDRFAPSLRTHVLSGQSSDGRGETLSALAAGDVLLLTYGLLNSEAERLAALRWNVACLDEAHTIKNRDTKTSAAAMRLGASHRLILTGTPVQNHLGELWNLFRFINPGLLGTYEQFTQKYVGGGEASAAALKKLVSPFLLRRTKTEVVRELPDKEEIVVPVSLSEDEAAVYEVLRREAVSEVEGSTTVSVNALSMITKLRMAACSASLAEKRWVGGCSKIEAFLDLLLPIVEGGNSVLIFSQFTSFLSMAKDAVSKAGVEEFLYLDGSTPVAQRQKMVDSFQSGRYKVFFISLKAGGLGLNLTGANYVIHLDPWWNPAIEQQATDRAYRIGQTQKVTVYHLISSRTIEEKILRLHSSKRNLADSILEGTNTSSALSPEELLAILG